MKLTKKLESEILKVYNTYWDSYFKGDMRAFASLLHENVQLIGSSENEVFNNKRSAMKFYKATAGQVAGKAGVQNRKIAMRLVGSNVLVIEQSDFYVLIDNEWSFYGSGRISTLLQKTDTGWKIIHEHGSLPDSKAGEGEQVNTERIKAENRQLREAVKRRTIELEHKNRELEIETALEKVRSSALGMKEPSDMVDVCRIISDQLELLKVKDIRNIQTAIINDEKGIYLNYEYFTQYKTTSTLEIEIKLHPTVIEFVNQIKKSSDAFFTKTFEGEALQDWREYRKKTNQNADPILDEATSVHYYFYSIGPGALGISTYAPLNEEAIAVFKRFRNVFELAYRRFIDIEKAEAQAREAQIELALERVRARTMGMQKSEELKEVIRVVYDQFVRLNIHIEHTGFIMDYKARDDMHIWLADQHEVPSLVTIPYFDCAHWNSFIEAKATGKDFFANHLTFEEKNKFYHDLFKLIPGVPLETKEYYFGCPGLAISTVLLENVGLYIENFSGVPYTDEDNNTLMRFGKVFQQTYTRFLDLQKAEAQAREAQIEVALEKVRSRTMGMQQSNELADVANVLFGEMNHLVHNLWTCGFVLCERDRQEDEWWLSLEDGFSRGFYLPNVNDYAHATLYEGWLQDEAFRTVQLDGDKLQAHYNWLMEIPVAKNIFDEMEEAGMQRPDWQKLHAAYFSKGYLVLITREPCGEEEIFKRFAQVFDQTYTRFLDLQKAEVQAREAKIEAALERTRTQSMIMQHSNELDDNLRVFHEQVLLLGIHSAFSFLWLPDEKNDRHIFWAAWGEQKNDSTVFKSKSINYPLDRNEPATAQCFVDWKSEDPVHSYHVPPAEVENYFVIWKELLGGVEKLKPEYFTGGLYYVEAFMKYGCFGVMIESDLKEDERKLLSRFAIEFERTYTRFLDLQKAEAQAREAKIEASLERVRSKAMAMHSPNDLSETVNVFFKELKTLGIIPIRCGVGQIDEVTRTTSLTTTTSSQQGESFQVIGKVKQTGHPVLDGIFDHWKLQKEYHPVLEGEDIKAYYDVMNAQIGYPEYPAGVTQYGNSFFFKEGFVFAWTENLLSEEELIIFRRFTSVLSLTYRRYLDLKEAEERNNIIQADNDRKTKELEDARQLQLSMLPKEIPELPHLDIAVYMKTATEVGGDYYDFNVDTDGTLTALVGDATGHGMMSGMMVSIMKSFFISHRTNIELKQFFENANNSIKDMHLGRLMMACIGVQITSEKIIATNAGMPSLLYFRNKSQKAGEFVSNNLPLGGMKDIIYSLKEIKYEKGDTLLLMSDGFAELKNETDEQYGYSRLKEEFKSVAQKSSDEIVEYLKNSAVEWANGIEPDDDVTFVVIKVK